MEHTSLPAPPGHTATVLNALEVAVVIVTSDGRVHSFNPAWQRSVEGSQASLYPGADFLQVCRNAWNLPSVDRIRTVLDQLKRGEFLDVTLTLPCMIRSKRKWIEAKVTSIPAESGNLAVISHRDITERVVSQALANGYTRWLNAVHHGDSLAELLRSLLRLVEEVVEGDHCAVLIPGGEHTADVVREGDIGLLFPHVWGTRVVSLPTGHPLVQALQDGRLYWTGDIRSDQAWEEHRDALVALGISSVWMVPVHGDGGQILAGCVMVSASTSPYDTVSCRMMAFVENLVRLTFERKMLENVRLKFEERMYHLAYHDHLTGLPNRARFVGALEEAWVDPDVSPAMLSVLYLDLDNFKEINDTLGHHMGDKLLLAAAPRVASLLADGELLARIGGDEFAILLQGSTSSTRAEELALTITTALETPIQFEGREHFIRFSIGIATADDNSRLPEDLLRNADMAMYHAKKRHKVPFIRFDDQLYLDLAASVTLRVDLRAALKRSEWWLAYQPVLDSRTGQLKAVEALVRWEHPTRGEIRPDIFIPVAEETGLIVPLGRAILWEACRQVVKWHAEYPHLAQMMVSVNLSPRQLTQELIADVREVLSATGLAPNLLQLEITETSALQEAASMPVLLALRDIGVNLAIDDFGTGYSALVALKTLPINVLKIDRSFVISMLDAQVDAAIVAAAVEFGKVLKVDVIAEGVERIEHIEALRELECYSIQGFCISKPLTPADFEKLLTSTGHTFLSPSLWTE